MKINKTFAFGLIAVFSLTVAGNEKKIEANLKIAKTEIAKALSLAANSAKEDPNEVFNTAINDYKSQFSNYLDVNGLNVEDKNDIELPDYNPEYISPEFYDVMHDYQINLETSLTHAQLDNYESLRKQDYNFDWYVTLNSIKFATLNPPLKYVHDKVPKDIITTPITPLHPTIPINNAGPSKIAAATAGIAGILSNVGLSQTVIAAFSACISTLTTGVSTSWIPFIGWGLAVALVTGALIALTVIIVKYWNQIKSAIEDIKVWFLEQFQTFSSLIDSFFSDAITKANDSTVVGRDEIGGQKIPWVKAELLAGAIAMSVAQKMDKKTVSLVKNVKKMLNPLDNLNYLSYWIATVTVTESFVKTFHLYDYGISTYTWYNDTARRMMVDGGSEKLLNDKAWTSYRLEYHPFLTKDEHSMNGWNHYHVFQKNPNWPKNNEDEFIPVENNPVRKAHSFFGPMFLRKTAYGKDYDGYPEMRKNHE